MMFRAFLVNHNAPPSEATKLTLHKQLVIRNEVDLQEEKEQEPEAPSKEQKERESRLQSEICNEKRQREIEREREHARRATRRW
jgi:hypothetical protein